MYLFMALLLPLSAVEMRADDETYIEKFLFDAEENDILLLQNEINNLDVIYFGMLRKAMEDSPEDARRIQLAAEISRKLLSGREVKL